MTAELAFLGNLPAPALDTIAYNDTVRLMRERRGRTQTWIANALGYTPQWESKVESGKIPLRGRDLARVAAVLDIPAEFLTKPSAQGQGIGAHFFSYKISARVRSQALAEANFTSTVLGHFLSHLTDVSKTLLPHYAPSAYGQSAHIVGAAIAWEMRQFWGLGTGPIEDLARHFERAGGFIRATGLLPDGITSAHSNPGWDYPTVILIDTELPTDAQLFALAHEIGHLIMDYGHTPPTVHDRADTEERANSFARELLMPADHVSEELATLTPGKLDAIGALQATWGLPLREIVEAAHHAEHLSTTQYRRWIQALNATTGDLVSPGLVKMQPTAVQKLLGEAYIGRGGWTLQEMADDAQVKEKDILALLGVETASNLSAEELLAGPRMATGTA